MHLRNIWKLWNEQRWKCITLSIQKCRTARNFFNVYYAIHDLCSTLKMTFCEDILRAVVIWFRVYVSRFFILLIRYPIACKTMESLDSTLAISLSNGCNTSIGSKRKKGGEKLFMKWVFIYLFGVSEMQIWTRAWTMRMYELKIRLKLQFLCEFMK